MRLTIAHGLVARAAPGPSLAQLATAREGDEEAGEKSVGAEPKLDRSAFVYLEPREAVDGKNYFALCASCYNFIPESFGRGAMRGDRCRLLGADFTVNDDSSCRLYAPWPDGKPCDGCQQHGAEKMVRGVHGSLSARDAGYRYDKVTRCGSCRHFEYDDNTCSMFEALNASLPAVFDLKTEVKPGARCLLWTDFPPPEMDNG